MNKSTMKTTTRQNSNSFMIDVLVGGDTKSFSSATKLSDKSQLYNECSIKDDQSSLSSPQSSSPTMTTTPTTSQSSKRALAPAPITKTIVSSITPANVRPIQATTTNKNVQYISFVPINSTQQIQTSTGTIVGTTTTTAGQISTKYLPIKQSKSSSAIKSTNLVQVGHGQKVIVNPNTIKISGTATTLQSSITTTIASTTTTTTASATNKSKNHATSVWMLPKQIIKANDSHGSSKSGGNLKYVPIAPNPNVANNTIGTDGAKITVNTVPKNL